MGINWHITKIKQNPALDSPKIDMFLSIPLG